jgi:hypothetical protein
VIVAAEPGEVAAASRERALDAVGSGRAPTGAQAKT